MACVSIGAALRIASALRVSVVDPVLDGGECPDRFDDQAQILHLGVGKFGADRRAQQFGPDRVVLLGQLDRLGQQHRALTRSQVVTRRLAGDGWVAEHAEHVVAKLERDAEVGAELVEDGLHVGTVRRRGGAQLQRARNRVRRSLVDVNGHRRCDRLGAAGLGDDVEILAAEDLGADGAPDPVHAPMRLERQVHRRDDVVGPHQGEIAEQDRRRDAELVRWPVPVAGAVFLGEQAMHRRQPAAGRRGVDDVVVHERAGVKQLERREQAQRLLLVRGIGVFGHRPPAPVCERRTQPLAAAKHELLQGSGQFAIVDAHVGALVAAVGKIGPQLLGDGAGQLDG